MAYITAKYIHEKLRKYKNVLLFLAGSLCVLFFSSFFFSVQKPMIKSTKTIIPIAKDAVFVPDQLLVEFKEGYTPFELEKQIRERQVKKSTPFGSLLVGGENFFNDARGEETPEERLQVVKKHLKDIGVVRFEKVFTSQDTSLERYYLLFLKQGSSVKTVKEKIDQLFEIDLSQPNYLVTFQLTPNDTYYSQMWNLKKISAEKAWDITTGVKGIIVAIVDTGIDYNHEDLRRDVIKGKDTINNDNDPMDDFGHGTHVAGIVGAATNNTKGVTGVNWNVQLMAVKVLDGQGAGNSFSTAQGIEYATQNGAKIINLSLGGKGSCSETPVIQQAITNAINKGVIVIAAAGNNGEDVSGYNPGSCTGVITVGATDQNDKRAIWSPQAGSNWGSQVDIAAPGSNILSLKASQCNPQFCRVTVGQNYMELPGTSMAAPQVTGLATLLLAISPNLSWQQMKQCLVENADSISTDKPIGPRVNAAKTLENCKNLTPSVSPNVTTPPGSSPAVTNPPVLSGKVLCVPVGGMQNKLNSTTLQVTNGKNEQVPIWIQENICDYSAKTPVVEGYQCNLYKRRYFDTLDSGESKTYTFSVPACKVGQIDVNTNNTTSKNYGGCFTPDNFQWTDGIGYAISANSTGCSVTVAPTASPKVTSSPGASGYTCVPDKECEEKGLQICNLKCTPK